MFSKVIQSQTKRRREHFWWKMFLDLDLDLDLLYGPNPTDYPRTSANVGA